MQELSTAVTFQKTNSTFHRDIEQYYNLKIIHRLNERCQNANNAVFAMSAQGLHPYGLNPFVSVDFYKKVLY